MDVTHSYSYVVVIVAIVTVVVVLVVWGVLLSIPVYFIGQPYTSGWSHHYRSGQ